MQRPWLRLPALVVGAALVAAAAAAGQVGAAAVPMRGPGAAADPRAPVAGPVLTPLAPASPSDPTSPGPSSPGPSTSAPEPTPAASPDQSTSAPDPSTSAPGPSEPAQGADWSVGSPLDQDAVAAALAPLLTGGALGAGRSPAHVVDVSTGEVLYAASDEPTVPASTMKLVTAVAVLDALGPDARIRTRVVVDTEPSIPRVVIVGAGDPSLVSAARKVGRTGTSLRPASMEQLAKSTARGLALRGITRVRVGYDASLFTGPALHPSWSRSFPPAGIVAPVSALVVDQGRRTPKGIGRVSDPAAEAGRMFADFLVQAGLDVTGRAKEVTAAEDAAPVAFVESPMVGALVERMLASSDNDYAEILGRLAAAASGAPASFTGVAEHAAQVLDELGVDARAARFADASGLSRRNRLAPSTVTGLLLTADGFGSLHSGLPVAGATGSLAARFRAPDQASARGVVRAKTGTLTGVGGLAGYVSRPDGRLLAFAFVDDSAPGGLLAVRAALDRATAALVTCDCAAP